MALDKEQRTITLNPHSLILGMMIIMLGVTSGGAGWYLAKKYDPPKIQNVTSELKIVIEEQLLRERAELIRALVDKIELNDCDTLVVHSVSKFLPEVDITCTKKRRRK